MIDDSMLKQHHSTLFGKIRNTGTAQQQDVAQLYFAAGLSLAETSKALNIKQTSSLAYISKLKKRLVLEPIPEYLGASRLINMLAVECERKSTTANPNISYELIAQNIQSIISSNATLRQKQIFDDYFILGLTQTDIAEKEQICQPSIYKSIMGNFDYSRNKFYGGIVSKVGKHLRRRNIPYCCNLVDIHGRILRWAHT